MNRPPSNIINTFTIILLGYETILIFVIFLLQSAWQTTSTGLSCRISSPKVSSNFELFELRKKLREPFAYLLSYTIKYIRTRSWVDRCVVSFIKHSTDSYIRTLLSRRVEFFIFVIEGIELLTLTNFLKPKLSVTFYADKDKLWWHEGMAIGMSVNLGKIMSVLYVVAFC